MATPTETPMGTGMALSRTATATEMGVTLSRMASRTGTSAAQPRTGTRTLQLSPLASPPAVADNPGLASPDGEGTDAHSDDSQNSPTPAGFDQYRLFAPPGHYQDQQNFVPMNGGSAGADREDLDDWVVAEDAAHPGDAGSWARKSTITSYSESAMLGSQHHDSHQHQHQHEHLKVGSWPGPERRSVVRMLERPQSQAGLGENPNWTPNANGQGEHADGSGTFALGENNMNGFDGNSNAHAHPDPDALGAHANRAPVASTLSRMWMKKQQQPTPNPYPTPQEHMY
ncbi:hypothetical protein C8R45DRAFT_1009784 [Mycena sanguinolenta]|nr:hypothetical protein C8R45DRAFT_1009784 [Mycena sanguinolenta]